MDLLATYLLQAGVAVAISLAGYLILNELIRYRLRNPLFAGPRGKPVFGDLLDLQNNAPEVLRQWSLQYGEVFQIQLGNVPVLVVNSAAAAKELLARQGHALNSRPVFYTFHRVVGKTSGFTIGTSPMSPELKRRRRAAATALNKPSVVSYGPLLHSETNLVIKDIYETSQQGRQQINPMPLVRRFALSIILTINWGTSITYDDKALFQEITEVEAGIVSTRSTMENFQDYIPLLRLNLFSARSHQAQSWRERREVYLARLDSDLRNRMEKDAQKPCIQSNAILDSEGKLSEQDLRTISTSLIQGGTGTISGTVSWALLFLSQNPDVQSKAHDEINGQFPSVECVLQKDSSSLDFQRDLPYTHALAQECLRYFTVLRLSLPRETTSDCTCGEILRSFALSDG